VGAVLKDRTGKEGWFISIADLSDLTTLPFADRVVFVLFNWQLEIGNKYKPFLTCSILIELLSCRVSGTDMIRHYALRLTSLRCVVGLLDSTGALRSTIKGKGLIAPAAV
jgi:hypothetical protein